MEEPIIINSNKFPCPNCGAFMIYSPKTEGLLCEYCGTDLDIDDDEIDIKEYKLSEAAEKASHNWGEEKHVFACNSCGGQTVVSVTEITTNCVFCGSAHVAVVDVDQGICPESVIPFKVEKEKGRKNFKKWIKGKFYAPNALRSTNKLDRLKSLYIPHFTYDSDTVTAYRGKRGTHYTVTTRRNGKTVSERRTRWRSVTGVYDHYYDDVLINASNKLDSKLIGQMKSYHLGDLKSYNEAFLVGHQTERYSISLESGWVSAKEDIDQLIYQGIRRQVGGDEFRLNSKQTNYGEILFKHILLPVWITSYQYKDKIYNVYINGQNGRVVGEYPKSLIKILLTIVGVALTVLFIYYFFVYNGGNIE